MSFVVVEDGHESLIKALVAVSERAGAQPCEVLIDCRDEVTVAVVAPELSGDVVFTASPADLPHPERVARLTRMARSANTLVVSVG